ncbi:MAG: N,N-dimethylformamidase beta subunit family domain-containing protein [Cyclobacteriaceae bacterium]
MKKPGNYLSRRELLKRAAQLGLTGAFIPKRDLSPLAGKSRGIIAAENKKAGTTDWQLTYIKSENYRSEIMEGYCSQTSVRSGESIDIFLSASTPSDVTVDLFRMGYYGGKGGCHITKLGPFQVTPQTTPPVGEDRLRECNWERTTSLTIPKNWVSGIYLGKLSCKEHRYESYIIFVVCDDRKADIMFQTSDTTWQAYNKWPDSYSLYDSDPPHRSVNATSWVSYDRPYAKYPQVFDQPLSQGSGEFLLWEFPLCYWLEQQGYDVTYTSNIDTHANPLGLARVKCFLSVGHDEYWSLEMYENVQSAVQKGLSVGFLCGNSVYSVIPLNQVNSKGQPHRLLRRDGFFGGVDAEKIAWESYMGTEPWVRHGPSERLLVGARTMIPFNGSGNWIVTNAKHWIFEGTRMKDGDFIPGLVGWEHHGDPAKIPGLEVIASGKVMLADGLESPYTSTIYPGPKGNWVFNASTIFWSLGLSQPPGSMPPYVHLGRPHGVDERVQKITSNFLKKCGVKTN